MLKVKDLSPEFQEIYIKYKRLKEKTNYIEKSTYEKTNDFLLEKNMRLLSKMSTEDIIINNHNRIIRSQKKKTAIETTLDSQFEKLVSIGKASRLQRKLHEMMLPESLIIPEEYEKNHKFQSIVSNKEVYADKSKILQTEINIPGFSANYNSNKDTHLQTIDNQTKISKFDHKQKYKLKLGKKKKATSISKNIQFAESTNNFNHLKEEKEENINDQLEVLKTISNKTQNIPTSLTRKSMAKKQSVLKALQSGTKLEEAARAAKKEAEERRKKVEKEKNDIVRKQNLFKFKLKLSKGNSNNFKKKNKNSIYYEILDDDLVYYSVIDNKYIKGRLMNLHPKTTQNKKTHKASLDGRKHKISLDDKNNESSSKSEDDNEPNKSHKEKTKVNHDKNKLFTLKLEELYSTIKDERKDLINSVKEYEKSKQEIHMKVNFFNKNY